MKNGSATCFRRSALASVRFVTGYYMGAGVAIIDIQSGLFLIRVLLCLEMLRVRMKVDRERLLHALPSHVH